MRKHLLLFIGLCFFSTSKAQSPITFTILNTSGSNSITCATPSIQLLCITNYTASFVTYTMAGPTGTFIGNNFSATLPGTYTLTAFVTNIINSTQTLAIGINTAAPVSAVSPTTQNITCSFTSATTVSATANPSVNITHIFITPSGNSLAIPGYSATYLPGMAGTHTHVLLDNFNGCKTSKIFLVNSVSGIPTLTLSCPQNFTLGCGSNSVCSVALGGSSSIPNNPISYTVLSASSSSNYVTNSQNLYQLTSPGTYTAISHDNTSSCEAKVLFSISSNTSTPNISLFTNTSTLSCANPNSILFGISTTPNTSYLWTAPGSSLVPNSYSIGVGTTGAPSNSVIGTYTFQVIDNINACSSETNIVIYQNIFPPNALIGNAGSNSVTCTTPSVVLTNQSTSGIPPSAFSNSLAVIPQLWIGPSTPSSSGTSSIVVFSVGVYSLTVLDPNNGCSAMATYTLGDARQYPIVNNPTAPPPFCLDPPTTSIDISPNLGGSISTYTYNWQAPSSATISGQNTATLNTNMVGNYTITVTNTVSGCSTIGNVTVTICTNMKSNSENKSGIGIYPNPSHGKFRIDNPDRMDIQSITLYNSEGKCLKVYETKSLEELNLDGETKGLYFITIRNSEGQLFYYKLLLN